MADSDPNFGLPATDGPSTGASEKKVDEGKGAPVNSGTVSPKGKRSRSPEKSKDGTNKRKPPVKPKVEVPKSHPGCLEPGFKCHYDLERAANAKPSPWAQHLKEYTLAHPDLSASCAELEARMYYTPANGKEKSIESIFKGAWKQKNPNHKNMGKKERAAKIKQDFKAFIAAHNHEFA